MSKISKSKTAISRSSSGYSNLPAQPVFTVNQVKNVWSRQNAGFLPTDSRLPMFYHPTMIQQNSPELYSRTIPGGPPIPQGYVFDQRYPMQTTNVDFGPRGYPNVPPPQQAMPEQRAYQNAAVYPNVSTENPKRVNSSGDNRNQKFPTSPPGPPQQVPLVRAGSSAHFNSPAMYPHYPQPPPMPVASYPTLLPPITNATGGFQHAYYQPPFEFMDGGYGSYGRHGHGHGCMGQQLGPCEDICLPFSRCFNRRSDARTNTHKLRVKCCKGVLESMRDVRGYKWRLCRKGCSMGVRSPFNCYSCLCGTRWKCDAGADVEEHPVILPKRKLRRSYRTRRNGPAWLPDKKSTPDRRTFANLVEQTRKTKNPNFIKNETCHVKTQQPLLRWMMSSVLGSWGPTTNSFLSKSQPYDDRKCLSAPHISTKKQSNQVLETLPIRKPANGGGNSGPRLSASDTATLKWASSTLPTEAVFALGEELVGIVRDKKRTDASLMSTIRVSTQLRPMKSHQNWRTWLN